MGPALKWIAVAVVAAGAATFMVQQAAPPAAPKPPQARVSPAGLPVETVVLAGKPFELEVAATRAHVEKGMSGRKELAENAGMLFCFPQSNILNFWMIDCLMDLDVAYLDRTGKVTDIYTMKAEPLQGKDESRQAYMNRLRRYPSSEDCLFAIEVRPGLLEKIGLKRGSQVKLDYARLRMHLK